MATGEPKITCGRAIGSKIVGHELVWYEAHFLEQFPHQFQCSPLVPLALDKNVEDFAFGIDGAPQVDQLAIDLDKHLIEVPSGMGLGPAPSKVGCDLGSEVFQPATYGFVRDH